MLEVIKRDGRIKNFDFKRIEDAVFKAYSEVCNGRNDDDLFTNYDSVIMDLASRFDNMESDLEKSLRLEVERIQDIIIETLEKYNRIVADAYKRYRDKRTKERESKSELLTNTSNIINLTNKDVLTENSNKQGVLFSTQRDLIAGEISKAIARNMIPDHLLEAHDSGLLKIHDLDYFMQGIYNCELVNLEDMLQNGTVINKKLIEKPKSIRTAMTLATQIAAQVASSTYGGQTISLSHLAPFVRVSRNNIWYKYKAMNLDIPTERLAELVMLELSDEIKDAVQTFNYQISTIMCTNGQAPFISICMYISENKEYEAETAMLIEEFFRQRIAGMKNQYGVKSIQTFPKMLYFLDDNNITEDSEYYWLTELAAKCTANTMNPDYISVKKMVEITGHAYPPMGCRAFLSPFEDRSGNYIFYGRGNLGVQTINLPYVALSSGGDIESFWNNLDEALELARQMCEIRYNKLEGVKAKSAPILWQHGAISRLDPDDDILKAVDERGFTVTIGYSGLYETVKYLSGESHTSKKGFRLAEDIMKYMKEALETFKARQPHLRFALYGTPQESTTGWFNDKLVRKFGIIKDITDKGWITNSYHVDIREEIDAFEKLNIESKLQNYSTGGAVSYIETHNMSKNIPAILTIIKHIYNTIMYAEINFECDVCGLCHYSGVMDSDSETLEWVCPQCGNRDQSSLSVGRRTCGYIGETEWTDGRKLDILNRVKHI